MKHSWYFCLPTISITWFCLRQCVSRCKITFSSLPCSYKWQCDTSGQWNEREGFWEGALKKLFKRNSVPLVYNFWSSTFSFLKFWMWRIHPVDTRQQPHIWMLHPELVASWKEPTSPRVLQSHLHQFLWPSSRILVSWKNKIYSVESLYFGYCGVNETF